MGDRRTRRICNNSIHAGLILCISVMLCSVAFGKVLNVPPVTQEQDQWCWAGASASVLAYYGRNVAQCTIAEYTRTHATRHDFGSVDCCVDPSQGCNYRNYNWGYPGSIEDILLNWGVGSTEDGYPLSQGEVTDQIDSDRPFIIRWGWTSGGGHFLVGRGIESSIVHYIDPLPGEGLKTASYDWVVSGRNHTWTHTQRMTTEYTEAPDLTGEWVLPLEPKCKTGKHGLLSCKLKGRLKVQNVGTRDAPDSNVEIHLVGHVIRFSTGTLGKGLSKTFKFSYPLPLGESPSGKFLAAFLDSNEEIPERNEENNLVILGPFQ